ncbi:MAG: protein jag [Minisyncoccia bacterium]
MDWNNFISELIKKMGFNDFKVDIDSEHGHALIFIHESENLIKENLPSFVSNLNQIIQLVAKKQNIKPVFVDINNYRKEREQLIIKLAKAAAKKVILTKQEIALPPMNSYERRIAHSELASNPEVITESYGKGKERHVVIKPANN